MSDKEDDRLEVEEEKQEAEEEEKQEEEDEEEEVADNDTSASDNEDEDEAEDEEEVVVPKKKKYLSKAIIEDSDDSDEEVRSKISDKDNIEKSDEEEEEEEVAAPKKKSRFKSILEESDDDNEENDDEEKKKDTKNEESESDSEFEAEKVKNSDADGSDSGQDEKKKKKDSDDDEDSDEDSDDEEEGQESSKRKAKDSDEDEDGSDDEKEKNEEDSDSDDDRKGYREPSGLVYDFDIMMAKKKEENSRKRRRRNYEVINDNDDFIADIINQMKSAVDDDMEANKNGKTALSKLKQLPFVMSQLRKVDLREAFLDSEVLSVITDWLTPLPDKSLPHLRIRESLLKILLDFNVCDVEKIKASAIGKAVMYLYKHPKETKENKTIAKKLISMWSRPIFQLDSSFSSISREEREERDMEMRDRHRQMAQSGENSDGETKIPASSKKDDGPRALKPGDKGWIPRARVPVPSMRDYVIRPRSTVEGDVGKSSRRPMTRLDKYAKSQMDRRRANRQQRAVNMKIDRI